MFSWSRLKTLLFFALPSLIPGLIAGTLPGYQIYKYTWYDAQFCTSCHVHDYANVGWQKSIHGNLTTCHDCHHQRLRDYLWETVVMIKDRPTFPKDLKHTPYIKKELCAACHVSNAADRSTITGPFKFENIAKIPKVDLSFLHSAHLKKQTDLILQNLSELQPNERDIENLHPNLDHNRTKGEKRNITCVDCHGGPQNRGHNFTAVDSSCVRCHEDSHQSKVAKVFGCRSCHFQDFMIPILEKKPGPELLPVEKDKNHE